MHKIKIFIGLLVVILFGASLQAQVVTAKTIFNQMAERYGAMRDYSASIRVTSEDPKDPSRTMVMNGRLRWKRENRLRIDFTSPREQILLSNGDQLQIYLSEYNVILSQKLDSTTGNPGGMATPEGLSMLKANYNIAFKTGTGLVPLGKDPAGENGYRLQLTWKDTKQGFREMEMLVSESFYIRKIIGITADNRTVIIEFEGLSVNAGIPDIMFTYDFPAGANAYEGFLFGNE